MKIVNFLRSARAWIETILVGALVFTFLTALVSFGKTRITAAIYADRLAAAHRSLEELTSHYNEAIAKTAVTELRVHQGRVSVLVRRADGTVQELPTNCNPQRAIYVDFIVMNGRLWIRRIFDEDTKPANATLIDPSLGSIPWEEAPDTLGKAVYRHLEEGRWVVTVTGNGALGLRRAPPHAAVTLPPPPTVRDFSVVMHDISQARQDISLVDMAKAALGMRVAAR